MSKIAMLIMFAVLFLAGAFLAIFSERWVDWITPFWEEKIRRKSPAEPNYVRSRNTEIWIYRIFGIFFALMALAMIIFVLISQIS
jgi:hypothetical protein